MLWQCGMWQHRCNIVQPQCVPIEHGNIKTRWWMRFQLYQLNINSMQPYWADSVVFVVVGFIFLSSSSFWINNSRLQCGGCEKSQVKLSDLLASGVALHSCHHAVWSYFFFSTACLKMCSCNVLIQGEDAEWKVWYKGAEGLPQR